MSWEESMIDTLVKNNQIIYYAYQKLIKLEKENKKSTPQYNLMIKLLKVSIANEECLYDEMKKNKKNDNIFEIIRPLKENKTVCTADDIIMNDKNALFIDRIYNKLCILGNYPMLTDSYHKIPRSSTSLLEEELYVCTLNLLGSPKRNVETKYNVSYAIPSIEKQFIKKGFDITKLEKTDTNYIVLPHSNAYYESLYEYLISEMLLSQEIEDDQILDNRCSFIRAIAQHISSHKTFLDSQWVKDLSKNPDYKHEYPNNKAKIKKLKKAFSMKKKDFQTIKNIKTN